MPFLGALCDPKVGRKMALFANCNFVWNKKEHAGYMTGNSNIKQATSELSFGGEILCDMQSAKNRELISLVGFKNLAETNQTLFGSQQPASMVEHEKCLSSNVC